MNSWLTRECARESSQVRPSRPSLEQGFLTRRVEGERPSPPDIRPAHPHHGSTTHTGTERRTEEVSGQGGATQRRTGESPSAETAAGRSRLGFSFHKGGAGEVSLSMSA